MPLSSARLFLASSVDIQRKNKKKKRKEKRDFCSLRGEEINWAEAGERDDKRPFPLSHTCSPLPLPRFFSDFSPPFPCLWFFLQFYHRAPQSSQNELFQYLTKQKMNNTRVSKASEKNEVSESFVRPTCVQPRSLVALRYTSITLSRR